MTSYGVVSKAGPSHTYLNIQVSGGSSVGADPNCNYSQQFQAAILDNPANYHLAIVRFSVPTGDIPLMIVPAQLGQSNPAMLTYGVGLSSSDGTRAFANVIWTPEDATVSPPAPPLTAQDTTSSKYYWAYSYQTLVDCINTAFASCVTQLAALGKTVVQPRLEFDITVNTYTLYAQQSTFEASVVNRCNVFMNKPLAAILPNFRTIFTGDPNYTYQFVIKLNPMATNVTAASDPYPSYVAMMQEFPNLQSQTALNTILLTTSVSVAGEFFSATAPYGSTLKGLTSSSNNARRILTDFVCNTTIGFEFKQGGIQYSPTAEYRLVDMEQTTPLTNFDLQVFWTDIYGNFYPLTLPPNQSFNCKVLFRRKDYTF